MEASAVEKMDKQKFLWIRHFEILQVFNSENNLTPV